MALREIKVAISDATDWKIAVRECAARLSHRAGDFAVAYVTDDFAPDLDEISDALSVATGVGHVVACAGMGICAGTGDGKPRELFGRHGMAVLAAEADEDSFRVFSVAPEGNGDELERLATWARNRFGALGIVHGDPRCGSSDEILADISERTGCILVGGLTAAPSVHAIPEAADQFADGPFHGGVSGVLLAGALEVASGLSQGCGPIGPVRRVTAAERNVIMTLDGQPALRCFIDDIGPDLAEDIGSLGGTIFAAKTLEGGRRGDYMVRNLVGIDPERGWLAIGDLVQPGERIMFCRRDHDTAVSDLREMLEDLKQRAGKPARGGVYHSCVARGPHMFESGQSEIELIRETLGDFPLIGFFGNGEISSGRLYGYTGVLTLFL